MASKSGAVGYRAPQGSRNPYDYPGGIVPNNIFDGAYGSMEEFCKQLDDRIGKHLSVEREVVLKTVAKATGERLGKIRKRLDRMHEALTDAELELFSSSVRGTISGLASHVEKDLDGHVVPRGALSYSLPIPLKSAHGLAIGVITSARETDDGLEIEATVADSASFKSSAIRKRLESAWAEIESGRWSGLSIGTHHWKLGDDQVCKSATLREVSVCASPTNQRCVIKSVTPSVRRERQALYFDGPYRDGGEYEPGDLVQARGTVFVCTKSTTGKPGSDDGWRLLVKTQKGQTDE